MPPAERRALLVLLGLAVAGQALRHLASRPDEPPGEIQLLATLSAGSPLSQRDSAMLRAKPLASGEKVDLDSASAIELARLPKVGPGLAKTILAYRQEHGPFGRLDALDRVPGVGPGLLKAVEPYVRFGGAGSLTPAPCQQADVPLTRCPPAQRTSAPLNINSATLIQLDSLPGIGPAKAAAILQYRQDHGPFAAVDELARVPGLGAGAVDRLRNRVSIH